MIAGRTSQRAIVAVLWALAGGLVFASAPALAVTKYVEVSSFGSGGALPASPLGLAVEQGSGEVLVADGASVQRFAPLIRSIPASGYVLGAPLSGSFAFAYGLGVDDSGGPSQGDVYVADEAGDTVDKFDAAGLPVAVDPPSNTTDQIGAGATPLALSEPTDAVVDPANGDVYVADYGTHEAKGSVVDIYTSAGEFVKQFAVGSSPTGLAFNSAGSDLYVVDGQLEEYDSSGKPVIQAAGPHAGEDNVVDGSEEVQAVAVDTSTNDVYVDERGGNIAVYESSGAPLPQLGFNTGIFYSLGIAVDSTTHTVFASDFINSVTDVFAQVVRPDVSTGQATATGTSAVLEGSVTPEGSAVTSCEFEYGMSSSYGQSEPCRQTLAEIATGSPPVSVNSQIKGLQPHVVYHYRLVASNSEGTEYGADEEFTTPSPPLVDGESFTAVGSTQATLHAQVNAAGSASTYQFEYSTSASPGSPGTRTLPVGFGEAQGDVSVSATVTGLQPDTVYHFRVLASNTHGVTPGVNETFITFPYGASSLPDGRRYEMVTPLENQNASVYVPDGPEVEKSASSTISTELPFQASSDGGAVAYVGDPSSGGNGSVGGGGEISISLRVP